ncbi:type IV pilin protein [Acidihalobacter yilgarnensis]|nr:type IV pilin protein [Acidihalobacter yilgarnensis]
MTNPMFRQRKGDSLRGFTLIELMITVVVAAILAIIAYPMYTGYVLKAHRTAAKTSLLEIASREERYYSTNNIYATSLLMLGYNGTGIDVPTGSSTPYYHVGLYATSTTYYNIRAIPIHSQINDTECGTFMLNSLGQKKVQNASPQVAANCWQ